MADGIGMQLRGKRKGLGMLLLRDELRLGPCSGLHVVRRMRARVGKLACVGSRGSRLCSCQEGMRIRGRILEVARGQRGEDGQAKAVKSERDGAADDTTGGCV